MTPLLTVVGASSGATLQASMVGCRGWFRRLCVGDLRLVGVVYWGGGWHVGKAYGVMGVILLIKLLS